MGRKRKKDGKIMCFYLRKDVYENLSKRRNMSDVVEEALDFVFEGHMAVIRRREEYEQLRRSYSDLQNEFENQKKENNRLKKKVEKQERELEKLKSKKEVLSKLGKNSREIQMIVDSVAEHLDEGKTWAAVMMDINIMGVGDQIDILQKLFYKNHGDREWLSRYIPWKLVKGDKGEGYVDYILKPNKKDAKERKTQKWGLCYENFENCSD